MHAIEVAQRRQNGVLSSGVRHPIYVNLLVVLQKGELNRSIAEDSWTPGRRNRERNRVSRRYRGFQRVTLRQVHVPRRHSVEIRIEIRQQENAGSPRPCLQLRGFGRFAG